MKEFDEVNYISKYTSTTAAAKTDFSPEEDQQLQTIMPQLTSLLEEIKSFNRGSLRWWLCRSWRNRKFTILFRGATKTSKTLASEFIAKKGKRVVYQIDISMVVGKYIGEKEKELNQLFDQAEKADWILFFDEADALFGKRTNISDAHDRFENEETNFLLQRLEKYNGVVIIAVKAENK
ncbi:MAG: AAA family ATPase, partial [Candidatus Hodarchaeales archaeon]